MRKRPIIALFSDFELSPRFVASMKGVIGTIFPPTRIIDIP